MWENVRYELEIKRLQTTRRHMWTYFSAMYHEDWKQHRKFKPELGLSGNTRLRGGEEIVLFRKPFPHALKSEHVSSRGVFTPPHFRISLDGCKTEEDKLDAIMSQNMNVFVKKNELNHPSEYTYIGVTPIPPIDYVCHGCGAVEKHFRADCETSCESEGVAHRSLDKVRRPHGIPKSQLRRVEKGEYVDAMKDDDGNYVIRNPVKKLQTTEYHESPKPHELVTSHDSSDPSPVEVDWMMADHFCVSRQRYRYRRTCFVEDCTPVSLDIEKSLGQLDEQVHQRETEFYNKYPSKRRKRNSTCTHWLRGLCVKGPLECEFMHNAAPEYMPVCKFYYNGECSNEDMCIFRHVEKVVPKKPCPDYVRGFCPRGGECDLGHIKRTEPYFPDWTGCGFTQEEFNNAVLYI
jgi:hypothetical protein